MTGDPRLQADMFQTLGDAYRRLGRSERCRAIAPERETGDLRCRTIAPVR